jgi:hypothetical protein
MKNSVVVVTVCVVKCRIEVHVILYLKNFLKGAVK